MSAHIDSFENGYFWELYIDLEHQLRDFLEYVPYLPENENVYSFKLLNMILSIGGHVDSALKEMIRYRGLAVNDEVVKIRKKLENCEEAFAEKRKPDYTDMVSMFRAFRVFEASHSLSTRKVEYKILPQRQTHEPFMAINSEPSRGWWSIYNGLKHDVASALKEATLRNAWDALACAFILNVAHQPAMERLWKHHQLMHDTGWDYAQTAQQGGLKKSVLVGWAENGTDKTIFVETPLFVYKYDSYQRKKEGVKP